jgi:Pyruvate/2-oxoacid:ferredoxin oxidoreductase delta subunit
MQTAHIHVFSGTGNSAHAAGVIQDALDRAGWQTQRIPVRRDTTAAATPADLHVFVFPVYACSVPHLMARHVRRLAPGGGARAAIICTTGRTNPQKPDGYEGAALMQARRMLTRRGYAVSLTDRLDYPASITNIWPPPAPALAGPMLREASELGAAIAARVVRGEPGIRGCSIANQVWSRLFGVLYACAGRFMLGKLFVADGACDGCRICEKACPAHAIRMMAGKPWWRWRCEGCERCMNLCPRRAVQVSPARILLFSAPLIWNPLPAVGFALLGTLGARPGVAIVVHLLAYAVALLLLDPVAGILERTPLVRRLFELSWTHRFRRYTAPGFDPKE